MVQVSPEFGATLDFAMMSTVRTKRSSLAVLLTGLFACQFAIASGPVHAEKKNTDPVFVFNRICYAQVPNLDRIRDMAQRLAWRAIHGGDLRRFTTIQKPDVLEGWDAQVGERVFRVAIVQSALSAKMRQAFPDLGDGKATSCMLVLDEQYDAETFGANMQTLAGKPPASKDVPEGDLVTTTWAGGSKELKVFLISKANAKGGGGLLSVTILTKAGYQPQSE